MGGKRRRQSTIPMVKQEANAILEEFLRRHQESLNSVTPMNSVYQKVSELEVFEEKPSSMRRSSYRKASHESLLSNESYHSVTQTEFTVEKASAPLASDEECSSGIDSPTSAPGFLCSSSKHRRHSSSNSTTSSSDTDLRDRRKKSLFKRAKERLRMSFNMTRKSKKVQAEREMDSDNVFIKKKDKKKKKKKKIKTKDKVVKEVTTHTKTFIRQSSTIADIPCQQTEITLREGDIWESKKIKDKNGESRNIKSHLSIKESSDTSSTKGLSSSFNKIKDLHKNGKKTLSLGRKESSEKKNLTDIIPRPRSISEGNDKAIHLIKEESIECKESTTTNVLNEIIARVEEDENDYPLIETSAPRNNMHLNISPIFTSELPGRGNFEFQAEHTETVRTVCTPNGLTQRRSSIEHHEHLNDCNKTEGNNDREIDEVDGAVGGVMSSEPSEDQMKKEMYKRVANKLINLADIHATSASDSEGACGSSILNDKNRRPELNELEKELVEYILSINTDSKFPSEAVVAILKHLTYQNFKEIMESYSKDKNGMQEEVAVLFYVSKAAISLVGPFRAMASQIKELALQYFEDKFAAFIVEKGGWDSVLEDTDEETKGE